MIWRFLDKSSSLENKNVNMSEAERPFYLNQIKNVLLSKKLKGRKHSSQQASDVNLEIYNYSILPVMGITLQS